MKIETDDIPT